MLQNPRPGHISTRIPRFLRFLLYHILGTLLGVLPFVFVYVTFVYVFEIDFQSGHKGLKALMTFLISVGLLWWFIHCLIDNPTFVKFSQWLEK